MTTSALASSAVLRRSLRKYFPAAVRGEGVYIWDSQGNRYLDLSGEHLLLAPPAIITGDQILWAGEQLREAIGEAAVNETGIPGCRECLLEHV